jgi:hypothetical protein
MLDSGVARSLRIAGGIAVVTAESLELLVVGGFIWTFRDFEFGGAPPPQGVTADTALALVLFGLLGLNVLAALTVAMVSALRHHPFGVRLVAAAQALDFCFGAAAMVYGALTSTPSDVDAGAPFVLLSGAGIALLLTMRGMS